MTTVYKYPPGTRVAQAIYSKGSDPEMARNPLIAALQPAWTAEMIGTAMNWWPEYDESCRTLTKEERLDLVMRLQYCFETLPPHLPIILGVLSAIRLSYLGRERFVHGYTEAIREKTLQMTGDRVSPPPEAKGQTFLLFSLPGNGKTWLTIRFGCLLPQVIEHTHFLGLPWPCRQVTHLRVVVQDGWTDKALAQAILAEFDRVAGTNYSSRAALGTNPSGFTYLLQFNLAAHNHGLGVLFVDEVQLLKNNQTLLTFILNFSTLVGVPLVLIGTPASKALMRADPRFMRRAEAPFDSELTRYAFPEMTAEEYEMRLADPDGPRDGWTYFVEAFWHLQYNAEAVPLSHELSFLLHYYSAGLIDYAIKLFMAAQLIRIGTRADRLDADAFKEAYFTCFKVSMPYLEALRHGNVPDLAKFEDFAGVTAETIAIAAAKVRIESASSDELSRLEEVRRQQRKKPSTGSVSPPPVPDPVVRSDLPKAPKDEFLK